MPRLLVLLVGPLRAVFEQGAKAAQAEWENEKKVHLLEKIGGPAALEAAVEILYEKIVADPNLAKFFDGVDMDKLKVHQRAF